MVVEQLLRVRHVANSTVLAVDVGALLAGLDDDQRRAVTAESQLVAVIAGAGSGKTRVLTRRVAYRVATGSADEGHTLVLTFTREAAGELRRRLPRLGLDGRVTSGTFHSVALGMLQQRWRDLDQPPRAVVSDRRRLVARVAPSGVDVDALTDEIGWAAARGLPAARYEAAVRAGERRPALDAQTVALALESYRRDKQQHGVVDLDDLLSLTIDAIEHDTAYADAQRWRFRHLLVDEAQDLNPLQHRLLDLLRAGRDDVFLVGDPAQAIYAFNGSDPGLLIDVERRFPGVEVVRLPVNHRSTPQVVGAGTHVLHRSGQQGEMRSARPDGAVVTIVAHDDERSEANGVARAISHLDRSLVRAGGVAVLARTNAQLPAIGQALSAAAVEVRRAVHGPGSAIQPVLGHVYRLGDVAHLRNWAQDALEGADPSADEAPPEQEVARAVLDFLRSQPMGDGQAFRAWVDSANPFGRSTPGVELLTFHAAKGREWHTVFLVGCETSLVPHRSATTTAGRAEEARLLHVAVTRATDSLVVNWARRRGGYQRKLTPWLDGLVSATPDTVAPPEALKSGTRPARDVILERLVTWRADLARTGDLLPEAVCPDSALAAIADSPPADAEQLDRLIGLGPITSRRLFPAIAAAIDAAQDRSTTTGA
jgi:DNA helicase-2/ATP-dependent DNA helicase PcrA